MSRRMTQAILLLLMLRNVVFASNHPRCLKGVTIGETPGIRGEKQIPKSEDCESSEHKCVRVEVAELNDPNDQILKDVAVMMCSLNCEDNFEKKDQEYLNNWVANVFTGIETKEYRKGNKGARAKCCSEPDCNKQSTSKQEEKNAGSKLKLSSLNLIAVVLFVGAFVE